MKPRFILFVLLFACMFALLRFGHAADPIQVGTKLSFTVQTPDQATGITLAADAFNADQLKRDTNWVSWTPLQYAEARFGDVVNSWASKVTANREATILGKYRAADDAKKAAIEIAVDNAAK